jgi:hypothetical protein
MPNPIYQNFFVDMLDSNSIFKSTNMPLHCEHSNLCVLLHGYHFEALLKLISNCNSCILLNQHPSILDPTEMRGVDVSCLSLLVMCITSICK